TAQLPASLYRNVPEGMSDFDRTAPVIKKEAAKTAAQKVSVPVTAAPEHKLVDVDLVVRDQVAERLFDDFAHKEAQQIQTEEVQAEAPVLQPEHDVAIPVPQHSDRVVATGEVWRALNSNEDQRHAQDIDALLKAAEEEQHQPAFEAPHASASGQPSPAHPHKTGLDWDDNAIFDELLAAVPQGKTASDVHSPFTAASSNKTLRVVENTPGTAAPVATSISGARRVENTALDVDFDDLDDLLVAEDEPKPVRASSYAQSSAFVQAPIQRAESVVSSAATNAAVHEALSKEEFIDAWQETAGKPQDEDEFDFDAPLTDAAGRPMSRAMQVAERRKDLSPLPGLDLLDEVDPNKKVNFTEEQLSRLSELLEIKLQEFN